MVNDAPWHNPGKWYSVPAYWDSEIQENISKNRDIRIIDSTLAEGEDMLGKHLGWNDWVEITNQLDDLGAQIITDPSGQPKDILNDYYETVRHNGIKADLYHKHIRGKLPLKEDWKEKVDKRLGLKADGFILTGKWPKKDIWNDFEDDSEYSKEEILAHIEEFVSYVSDKNKETGRDAELIFGFVYSFDHRLETLVDFCAKGVESGADSVYIFDSTGQSNPQTTRLICERIKERIGNADLFVQHHNDLGMSTACGLAAAEGGADVLDCTIGGVGERGGTAPLEEVSCSLEVYGWDTGIDLGKLNSIVDLIKKSMDIDYAPHKPIVGSQTNKEEGWGHRDPDDPPESALPLAGEVLNRPFESEIGYNLFTKKGTSETGRHGRKDGEEFLKTKLNNMDQEHSDKDFEKVKDRLLDQLMAHGSITIDEFETLVEGVVGRSETRSDQS